MALISIAGATSFTKNQTECTPICAVSFTDTSGGNQKWLWTFQELEDPIEHVFSTAKNPIYGFGEGKFSIRLTVDGVTTPINTEWVNVSAGGIDGVDYNIPISTTNMKIYPDDYFIYADISNLSTYAKSDAYIARENEKCTGHTYGCNIYQSRGTEVEIVNGSGLADQQILHPIYKTRNTLNPVPIPDNPATRGWSGGEDALFILDWVGKRGFESYHSDNPIAQNDNGTWTTTYTVEADYSSYDITCGGGKYMGISNSGLPTMPLLLTYEEVVNGDVQHASMVHTYTNGVTKVYPACYGHLDNDPDAIPVGSRLRLKQSFNINNPEFNEYERTILKGWQDHGLIVYDGNYNIYSWTVMGMEYPDIRWDDIGVVSSSFENVHASNFEVVNFTPMIISPTSGKINPNPVIIDYDHIADFTMSSSAVRANTPVIFNATADYPNGWKWVWGDGTTSTTKTVSKTYKKVGKYSLSLTTLKDGAVLGTKTLQIRVVK